MTIRELLAEESPTLRRRLASLFSGLPDETPASPLSCAAGEVVVRQDAPCRCVYVLVEGRPTPPGSSPEAPPTPTPSSAPSPSSGSTRPCAGQIAFWPRCVPEPPAGFGCSPGRTTSPGSSPAGTPPSPGYGRWCAACGSRPAGSGVTCLWTATAAFSPSWSPGMRPTPEAGRPASP